MARTKTASKTAGNASASKAKPAGANLDLIAKALAKGDAVAALVAALDTWRAARSPALANLIDVLDTRVVFPPITDDLEWTEIAFTKDPLALGRLLSTIRDLPASFLPSAIGKLAAFPDDPRIGTAAAAWILEPPTVSSSTYPFWSGLYKLLERIGDTRVVTAIAKRVKRAPPATKRWAGDKNPKPSQFWGKFYGHLEDTRDKLSQLATPVVDKALLAKLDKQASKLPTSSAAKPAVTGSTKAPAKDPALTRALAHATKQQVPEAIAALLDAWRDKRAPELAELIDRATTLLPNYRGTFPAAPKDAAAAWQAAFDRDPAGELPRLLRHVHVGGAAEATEHVVALATLSDDPRIASRLAELAVTLDIGPERSQYWRSTWALIARTRDVRVIPSLRQDFNDFSGTYYDHHRSGKRLLGEWVLAEPPASLLDAADHKAVNRISAALDKIVPEHLARERALIADISANWDDDGPRLVYADWLIERDHIAGQLIVLACKLAREKALSKAEGKQLATLRGRFRVPTYPFGAISDYGFSLDRGLPSQIKITWNSSPITMRHLAADPMLALLAVIDFDCHDRRGIPAAPDLARVMLEASRLTRVTGVPHELGLAATLEPLVKARWKRDGKVFLRR